MNPTLVNIVFGTLAGLAWFFALALVPLGLGGDRRDRRARWVVRGASLCLSFCAGALITVAGGWQVLGLSALAAVLLIALGLWWLRAYGDKAGW